MGASLASPGAKSRSVRTNHLDGYTTSRLPTSKSTNGFRDKSSNIFKTGFISSLHFKKLTINSGKKRNPDENGNHSPSNDYHQTMVTVNGFPRDVICEDVENNNQEINRHHHLKQPPPPIHHHSRISANNLTKSLSCYTLKLNPRIEKPPEPRDYKKTVIQASTSELLMNLGQFICHQCYRLEYLQPETIISWIRAIDRSLILQGWSEIAFINPANVVFLYVLIKDYLSHSGIGSERELQCVVLTCLYLAYSYTGNEISYPLKPFMVDENRDIFWNRCLSIVNRCSHVMLKLNSNTAYFTDTFSELKFYISK